MTTYYVAGDGNDSNSGLTRTTAKRNLRSVPLASGDTLKVCAGDFFPRSVGESQIYLDGKTNIKIEANSGEAQPRIFTQGKTFDLFRIINSSNIEISGLYLQGHANQLTYQYAYDHRSERLTNPAINDNGISFVNCHHVTVKNCKAELFGGAAYFANQSDYITIDGCEAYGCCNWSPWGVQAIALLELKNSDTLAGVHNRIINCTTSYNRSYIVWWVIEEQEPTRGITEGHGIILDTLSKYNYVGETLIDNCVAEGNGGSGISVYSSNNFTVSNCTLANNCQSPDRVEGGNLGVGTASNFKLLNNQIAASATVPRITLANFSGGQVTFPTISAKIKVI